MNGNSQRKALWWLANKLKAYAERGEFDDKGWFAYFGGKPPTDESMRQRVLYSPVLMDSYQGLADLQANPLISQALIYAAQELNSEDHKLLYEALLAAGVSRTNAQWVKPPKMLNPVFQLLEQLDTLVNRLADPPSEADGRTVLDALIEALRAIAPPPKKPTANDKKRFTAFNAGNSIKSIAIAWRVTEKAVEKSLTIVRQWNEYHGIASGPKGKRGRTKHSLAGMADAKALRPDELAED